MPTPDTALTGEGLNVIPAGEVLVTPTGGEQGKLSDLLEAGQGISGPVEATTLSASDDVDLSPTGTVTINPSVASTMDNVEVGKTTPLAVHATTLSASGDVDLTPTGTVAIGGSVAGTMDNVEIGKTTALPGKFTTITSATDAAVILTNQTDGAASNAGTLTNAPAVGDPVIWVPIKVNGTLRHFPAW